MFPGGCECIIIIICHNIIFGLCINMNMLEYGRMFYVTINKIIIILYYGFFS